MYFTAAVVLQVLAAVWRALGAGLAVETIPPVHGPGLKPSGGPALKREAPGADTGRNGGRGGALKRLRKLFDAGDQEDLNLMGPGSGLTGSGGAGDAAGTGQGGVMEGVMMDCTGLGRGHAEALRPLLLPMLHRHVEALGPCYARFVCLLDQGDVRRPKGEAG